MKPNRWRGSRSPWPRILLAGALLVFLIYALWAFQTLTGHHPYSGDGTTKEATPPVTVVQQPASQQQIPSQTSPTTNSGANSPPPSPFPPAPATSKTVDHGTSQPTSGQPVVGRNSGSQLTVQDRGGTLFTWGLQESWRLGQMPGDSSIPQASLSHLKNGGWGRGQGTGDSSIHQASLSHLKVSSISGIRHSAIATSDGILWAASSISGIRHSAIATSDRIVWTASSISGSRHAALATSDGIVWTMGHNDSRGGGGYGSEPMDASGQLGRGGSHEPGIVNATLQDKRVVQVTTGRYHSLPVTEYPDCRVPLMAGYNTFVLDDQGNLYAWGLDGCSAGGQFPEKSTAWKARQMKGELEGKKVVAFDSGYILWIAATADGAVYTCNTQDDGYGATLVEDKKWNLHGELGRDGNPLVESELEGKRVVSVAAGREHSLAVKGELEGQRVVSVAAGREHSLAVTDAGRVYSWGGRDIVTGRGEGATAESLTRPGLVGGDLANDKVLFVAGGEYLALTASATAFYGWGGDDYLIYFSLTASATAVYGWGGDDYLIYFSLTASATAVYGWGGDDYLIYFSLAASATAVYGWGSNDYLTLGVGKNNPVQKLEGKDRGDVMAPTKVAGPLGDGTWLILGLAAGYQHSMAIAMKNPIEAPAQENALGTAGYQHSMAIAMKNPIEAPAQENALGTDVLSVTRTSSPATTISPSEASLPSERSSESKTTSASGSVTIPARSAEEDVDHISYANAQAMAPSYNTAEYWESYKPSPRHDLIASTSAEEYWDSYTPSPRHDLIASTSADVFQSLPTKFENKFRNPCLYNSSTEPQAVHCTPFYHIISVFPSTRSELLTQEPYLIYCTGNPVGSPVGTTLRLNQGHYAASPSSISLTLHHTQISVSHLRRNPCWYNSSTEPRALRCIPFYHIIGVSKCGTTDLYNRLAKHPNIYESLNKCNTTDLYNCLTKHPNIHESLNKGPHWWDECPYPVKKACSAPPNGDFEGYIDLFRKAADRIETDVDGITGDASSNTYTSAMAAASVDEITGDVSSNTHTSAMGVYQGATSFSGGQPHFQGANLISGGETSYSGGPTSSHHPNILSLNILSLNILSPNILSQTTQTAANPRHPKPTSGAPQNSANPTAATNSPPNRAQPKQPRTQQPRTESRTNRHPTDGTQTAATQKPARKQPRPNSKGSRTQSRAPNSRAPKQPKAAPNSRSPKTEHPTAAHPTSRTNSPHPTTASQQRAPKSRATKKPRSPNSRAPNSRAPKRRAPQQPLHQRETQIARTNRLSHPTAAHPTAAHGTARTQTAAHPKPRTQPAADQQRATQQPRTNSRSPTAAHPNRRATQQPAHPQKGRAPTAAPATAAHPTAAHPNSRAQTAEPPNSKRTQQPRTQQRKQQGRARTQRTNSSRTEQPRTQQPRTETDGTNSRDPTAAPQSSEHRKPRNQKRAPNSRAPKISRAPTARAPKGEQGHAAHPTAAHPTALTEKESTPKARAPNSAHQTAANPTAATEQGAVLFLLSILSPNILLIFRGSTSTKDVNVTMPELLREASPFLRLIIIFRNPIDRYFSAFYYYRHWAKDAPTPGPDDFHAIAEKDIADWNNCVASKGQDKCIRLYNPQQLVKGMYSEFMADWLRHFPREQLLILRNEDYKVAQKEHMKAVFKFLGVKAELSEEKWNTVMSMPIKNVGKNKKQMHDKTRIMLEEFYRPFNERLAGQMKDLRYLWEDGKKALPASSSTTQAATALPVTTTTSLPTTTSALGSHSVRQAAETVTVVKATPSSELDPAYHVDYAVAQSAAPGYNTAASWETFVRSPKHDQIVKTSPDVFELLPEKLESKFRNPCWYQTKEDQKKLRCIPFYHILGVSKCGTTDLYNRLARHPDIYESLNKCATTDLYNRLAMHPDIYESLNEGPHWWDECAFPLKGACTAPPNGDFDGYVDLFRNAAKKIEANPNGITGDASSNTFTAARGVYLRWWEKDKPPPGPDDFHANVELELGEWNACVSSKGHGHCVRHYHPQQLVKGMYSEFIDDWLNNFPRDQLLFLRNEDYKVAQREHMQVVFKFLGVKDDLGTEKWSQVMDMPIKNVGKHKQKMHDKTRTMLEEFYRPFNEKLAERLKDERYLWKTS
eukprot:gene24282-9881_t